MIRCSHIFVIFKHAHLSMMVPQAKSMLVVFATLLMSGQGWMRLGEDGASCDEAGLDGTRRGKARLTRMRWDEAGQDGQGNARL